MGPHCYTEKFYSTGFLEVLKSCKNHTHAIKTLSPFNLSDKGDWFPSGHQCLPVGGEEGGAAGSWAGAWAE
jgi:hypothetical protein